MQYEEYRDRMVAQGRTPADRERYASQVEAGYMLANLTRDEFCALPDRAIAELSRAANRCAEYDRRAVAAAQESERLRVAVLNAVVEARDARGEIEKLTAAKNSLSAEAEALRSNWCSLQDSNSRLRDELAERDALIERLLQAMTVDQTRRFMLSQMAAAPEVAE